MVRVMTALLALAPLVACVEAERGSGAAPLGAVSSWVRKPGSFRRSLLVRGGQDGQEQDSGVMDMEALARTSFVDLLGETLVCESEDGKGTKEVSAAETLKGKHVAVYFCSKQVEDKVVEATEGQGTRPTEVIKTAYEQAKKDGHEFEVVYVPVAEGEEDFNAQMNSMPWHAVKLSNSTVVNLMRKGGIAMIPSVVVVDPEGEVVTTEGYANMAYFPENFPWKSKSLRQLLGDNFIKADGSSVKADALEGKTLGVYFSGKWCAPCQQFTPVLKEAYEALQAQGKDFEVVYVSSDKTADEFNAYLAEMPWLAVPFEGKAKSLIAAVLGVRALPTLLIYDENDKLITIDGRMELAKDAQGGNPGASFPWAPKPLADLSDSPEALARGPTLVVFADGLDKGEQQKLTAELKAVAEERQKASEEGIVRPITTLIATEIDQMSGAIRKLCGLDEIQGKWRFMKSKKSIMKPKMAIVSLIEGQFAMSEANEVNAATVKSFFGELDEGKLELQKFDIPDAAGDEDGAEP
jgi:nucleoredoxin